MPSERPIARHPNSELTAKELKALLDRTRGGSTHGVMSFVVAYFIIGLAVVALAVIGAFCI